MPLKSGTFFFPKVLLLVLEWVSCKDDCASLILRPLFAHCSLPLCASNPLERHLSPISHRHSLKQADTDMYASRFVCSVGIVPQWFSKRRSFANSIAAAGSGIGGLTYSLASQAMIQSIGLGWAFRVLAILAFAVNTLCTILIRDRNKAVGAVHLAFDVKLFKRKEFFLLQLWGFFSMLGYIVLLFSLPNYARSIGLSAKQGSIIGALLNLGQGKSWKPGA